MFKALNTQTGKEVIILDREWMERLNVTLEKRLDRDFLPRPVDCWVETKQDRFAYWLVEAQVEPQQRDAFLDGFDDLGVKIHWVFLTRIWYSGWPTPG